MKHDVFLSYSQNDRDIAEAVCRSLEAEGVRCWMAHRDIPPAKEWGSAILEAIEQAKLLVILFSSKSNNSKQVLREVERAVKNELSILPVRLEDVPPSKSLEYFLSVTQWFDALTPSRESHWARLTRDVLRILGRSSDPPPTGFSSDNLTGPASRGTGENVSTAAAHIPGSAGGSARESQTSLPTLPAPPPPSQLYKRLSRYKSWLIVVATLGLAAALILALKMPLFKQGSTPGVRQPEGERPAADLNGSSDGLITPRPLQPLLEQHVIDQVLQVASSQVGVMETSPNRGPEVDSYVRSVGLTPAGRFNWSYPFIYWCFEQATRKAGVPNPAIKTNGLSVFRYTSKARGALHLPQEIAVN